jgi:drug/metabolite transporter (DMT)-like permease
VKPRDVLELLALAALWGASFLLMRVAAPAFGPFALVFVRVAGAGALLLPLLLQRGEGPALRAHWRPILVVGLTNSALPFLCFTVAALAINAGVSSIFNATTPLWAALIGWAWLHDRPARSRWWGLAIGFAGVVGLALDKASLVPGAHGVSPALAVAACLAAAMLYGFSANFAKRRLQGVPPMALAAGSQLSAAATLALPAAWAWPTQTPPASAWTAAAALAVACTALAYVLYFRLIAHAGPANAASVTFLIPAFAIGWGWLFLDEALTPPMALGCGVILFGTALATGVLRWPTPRPRPA